MVLFDQRDQELGELVAMVVGYFKNDQNLNLAIPKYDLTLVGTINSDSYSIWIKLTDEEQDDIIDYKALAV